MGSRLPIQSVKRCKRGPSNGQTCSGLTDMSVRSFFLQNKADAGRAAYEFGIGRVKGRFMGKMSMAMGPEVIRFSAYCNLL